jgi:hypothetical protein
LAWPNGERDLPIWQPPPTPKSEQKEAEGDALFQMYNPPMLGLLDELDKCKRPVVVGDYDNDGHGDLFLANAKGTPLRTSVTGITGIAATPSLLNRTVV